MSNASAELLRGLGEEEEPKKIYGVVTATVGPLPDPLFQGRVQVLLHFLDSCDASAFARVATLFTGIMSGSYFVPMPGDEVLVAFEQGDVNSPYIIGSLWNLAHLPPLPAQLPMIKAIRTTAGNQIVFSDVPPSLTIQVAAPAAVPATPSGPANMIMSPAGIQFVCGTTTMIISPAGITLQSGQNVITMTAGGINIASAAPVSIVGVPIRLN